MLKRILGVLLIASMAAFMVACTTSSKSDAQNSALEESSELLEESEVSEIVSEATTTPSDEELLSRVDLQGAQPNIYDGIEISVAQNRAIALPGTEQTVQVSIQNTGDKDVSFAHGSSSVEIPSALQLLSTTGLVVLPESQIATMDFQTKILKAGESLNLSVVVKMPGEPLGEIDTTSTEESAPETGGGAISVEKGLFVFFYTVYDEEISAVDPTATPQGYTTAEVFFSVIDDTSER